MTRDHPFNLIELIYIINHFHVFSSILIVLNLCVSMVDIFIGCQYCTLIVRHQPDTYTTIWASSNTWIECTDVIVECTTTAAATATYAAWSIIIIVVQTEIRIGIRMSDVGTLLVVLLLLNRRTLLEYLGDENTSRINYDFDVVSILRNERLIIWFPSNKTTCKVLSKFTHAKEIPWKAFNASMFIFKFSNDREIWHSTLVKSYSNENTILHSIAMG